MDEREPSWLPPLILFEDFHGNWAAYIEALYQSFCQDFVVNRPLFENLPIFTRFHPQHLDKGATFWHLISEGEREDDRTPDLRRCERIRWPRSLIDNAPFVSEIRVWETTRAWKHQKQRRRILALEEFHYIVVLAESSRGWNLVTAYGVERSRQREKLRKEYEAFAGQKKEGSAV